MQLTNRHDLRLYIDNLALEAISRLTRFTADEKLQSQLLRQFKSIRAIIEKS